MLTWSHWMRGISCQCDAPIATVPRNGNPISHSVISDICIVWHPQDRRPEGLAHGGGFLLELRKPASGIQRFVRLAQPAGDHLESPVGRIFWVGNILD